MSRIWSKLPIDVTEWHISLLSSHTSSSVINDYLIAEFELIFLCWIEKKDSSRSIFKNSCSGSFRKIHNKITTRQYNFCNVVDLNPATLLKGPHNRDYFQRNFTKFFELIFPWKLDNKLPSRLNMEMPAESWQ